MYLERTWQLNNARYKCILPAYLHNIDLSKLSPLPVLKTADIDQHFKIKDFTARYLAGGVCLKEGRTVSRRRLALCSLNLAPEDYLATMVHQQTRQYTDAVTRFSQTDISLPLLCQLQAQLNSNDKQKGQIRTVQNWLGGPSPDKAHFVPPPAEYLPPMLEDWLNFICTHQPPGLEHIIAISNQLILLHPFTDGNGRLHRALTDSLLSAQTQHPASYISPFLYRLGHCHSGYHKTPTAILHGDWTQVLAFWSDAINWSNETSAWLLSTIQQLQKTLLQSLALRTTTPAITSILSLLINQPILTTRHTANLTQFSEAEVQFALDTLVEFGTLQRYQLRQPINSIIYECKWVFDAYLAMDERLFISTALQ